MYYSSLLGLTIGVAVLMAIVAWKAAWSRTTEVFLLFAGAVLLWLLTNYLIGYFDDHTLIFTSLRLTFTTASVMLYLLFILSLEFPQQLFTGVRRIELLAAIPAAVAIALSVTDGLVTSFTRDPDRLIRQATFGDGYLVFVGTFLLFVVSILVILFLQYRKAKGFLREQIKYLFTGIFLMFVYGSITDLVLPAYFHLDAAANYGPFGVIFLLGFTGYAIAAHRLFDIRVIIRRTVVFAGLSAFVLGSYAAIMFTATALLGGSGQSAFSASQFVPNMLAAFAIALGFEPLRRWLSRTTDTWLFAAEYDSEVLLAALSTDLANAVDLVDAAEGMIEIVTTQMRLASGAVFLVQPAEEKGEYELKQLISAGYDEQQKATLGLEPNDALVQFFQHEHDGEHEHTGLVVIDELERQHGDADLTKAQATMAAAFIKRVRAIGGAVAMPLYITRREPIPTAPGTPPQYKEVETFIGVLVLGEKKSGDAFSDEDLRLLEIVASQTAGAVEKSRLFEEDQLKSEFVAVASHELLTPTAAMEGYLSMILDEGLGKVDKQARTYLETVYSESKRLAALVKDLLNVSRIERGKILVNPEPIALDEVVEQVLASLKFRAEERKIVIQFKKTPSLPKVQADKDKLVEVFMNLVGNSIKYTPEGGKAEITTEVQDGFVAVRVKDNGIGMKPEDAQHLFSKFFRASNSDQTGQGGTGLGLYITKNVIELMGGTITVETALGKGSAFTFTLPVAKG